MGFLLKFFGWLVSDIWHLIAMILAVAVVVFYIGWKYETHEANKYQEQAIKYENAFEQQKEQTKLCEKNKKEVLAACNENKKTSQDTLGSCDRLLKICEKKKGGNCLDKETLNELGTITNRFNDGMQPLRAGASN